MENPEKKSQMRQPNGHRGSPRGGAYSSNLWVKTTGKTRNENGGGHGHRKSFWRGWNSSFLIIGGAPKKGKKSYESGIKKIGD